MKRLVLYIVCLLFVPKLWSQAGGNSPKMDSIHIKEVVVKDRFVCAIVAVEANPSCSSGTSLANFLPNYTYFKNYGTGNLSTIAIRGTTASQTDVLWNGININSSLNGQTDFSTIIYNSENFRGIYMNSNKHLASNAVGGVVSLSEKINFKDKKDLVTVVGLGSYNTFDTSIRGKYATEKIYTSLSYSAIQSENDYTYYNTTINNDNANYTTRNVDATVAYKLNDNNRIKVQFLDMLTDRNTARTLSSTNNAHLLLGTQVALANYQYKKGKIQHEIQFALKNEKSNYQFDKDFDMYSKHAAKQYSWSYKPSYTWKDKSVLTVFISNEKTQANGDNIAIATTNLIKFRTSFKKQLTKNNYFSLKLGQDISSVYIAPFLFGLNAKYEYKNTTVEAALANNYRLPTFNDLYWNPGGNPSLQSEQSINADLSFSVYKNNWKPSLSLFLIDSRDLIKWRPATGNVWSPININKARNYGVESQLTYVSPSVDFLSSIAYIYTKAIDLDLEKQLTYVPQHQFSFDMTYYGVKKLKLKLHANYTGKVFTTTSNTQFLKAYLVSDLVAEYTFKKSLTLKLSINNISNTKYMAYADRPMPQRNFKLQIIYNPKFNKNNKNETTE